MVAAEAGVMCTIDLDTNSLTEKYFMIDSYLNVHR